MIKEEQLIELVGPGNVSHDPASCRNTPQI